VRVLGPLQVSQGDRVWSPGGPKERKLLAVLALRLGEVVSVDAIADALWDGAPPSRAVKSVQVYVSRVRAALDPTRSAPPVIQTAAPGYRLVLDRGDVDANAFVDLVRAAREANERGEPGQALTYVDEAFTLWRGEPYAEFADSEYFVSDVRRLTETRLAGLDARLAAGLAQGRHAELVVEAEALCAQYPLREGLWVHLVTALYRCGRQADALAALRRLRTLLAEEIGADPSAELVSLEQAVLRQDPALSAPGTGPTGLPPALDPAGRLFVGRSGDLAWLRQAWSQVAAGGHARLLAVAGPSGSGRTRLLAEFAAGLHADGVAIHYGTVGSGLAVLDDIDMDDTDDVRDRAVAQFRAVARSGPLLCVVTYDPDRVGPPVRRALVDAGARERVLPPLDRSEVAEIVVDLAGPVDADLVAQIAVAAGGWPGAVQRLTMRLVEERSVQRVAVAAEQAGPASRALSVARGEVAAGVRELTRLRARPAEPAVEAGRLACPYKGLAAYEQADAPLFHGREELVSGLCARLVDTPFVAVVGASGAGKSSLVRAGLLPALANGVLPNLADAPQWILTPGAPLPAVDGAAVVVVDQFEEIFTGLVDEPTRERYLDDLTGLASNPGVRVVVVLRADFVGACATHPLLAELVGAGTVLVGPMRPQEVRRAVELPARHVGLRIEPSLADAIVSDVEGQPGGLPLLSTALVEAWQHRSGPTLTSAAYHQAGGISGAVARLGEAAYTSLDGPGREAARRLLLRLAETDDSGGLVRRRVPREELGDDHATARALALFVARRLLTTSERGVEVTHEAVLTYWPRLAGWLADDEQGRALRRHLAPTALDWDTTGRPESELYRGARLAAALDWTDERRTDLTTIERDFLEASRDHADRELREEVARADRQARGRRRLRVALAAALVLLLVATSAAFVAVDRQRAAVAAGRESLARRLGALALVTPDLDRSLLLGVQALRTHDDWETRGDLLAVLSRHPQALRQVRGATDKGVIAQVAVTRDGSTVVAAGGGGGRIYTWDAATLAPTAEAGSIAVAARSVIPGPDPHGVFVTAAIDLDTGSQAVVSWDAVARRTIATYPLPAGLIGSSRRPAVSADGQTLVVATLGTDLLFYDLATGALRGRTQLPEPAGDIWPAGPLMVTAGINGGVAYVLDPGRSRMVSTLPLPFAGNVTASPDGRALLVVSGSRASLVSTEDGHVIRDFAGATRSATVAAFSPDGSVVAVGGEDQVIGVWDTATGQLRDTLRGHAAPVHAMAFAGDGRTLYSASGDNSVIAWDVVGDRSFAVRSSRVANLPPARSAYVGLTTVVWPVVGWSSDRAQVYLNAPDGTGAAVVDVATGRAARAVAPFELDPSAAAPIGDVDRQAVYLTTIDGELVRRELASGAVTRTSSADAPSTWFAVAVSGDGRTLAATAENYDAPDPGEHNVDVLDAQTLQVRRRLGPLDHSSFGTWLNGDGSLMVAASDGPAHHLELWDTGSGGRRWITDIDYDQVVTVAWSPDGRTLLAATLRGEVVTVDLASGEVAAHYAGQISSRLVSADFSPDGAVVAVGGDDAQVHLFEAATLREIGTLPMVTGSHYAFAAFHPDGSRLSAVDERGYVVEWDIRPTKWIDRACATAGRDLTPAEWATYLPGVAYRPTCPAT
jgi:DNA-binding SARP family transcriptional activator/WD40 repeat protein